MEAVELTSIRNQLNVRKERLNEAIANLPDKSNLVGLLKQVDKALEKLNHGTYGICEVCHDPVEEDRLLVDPLISVCLGCLNEVQKRALESDLEFAAKIQRNLLPKKDFSINGWDFDYHYNPAGPVSGDFTDIIPVDNNSFFFVLGDVSGKGIGASLMMSQLHSLIRTLLSFDLSVCEIVEKANRLFCESTLYSNYATMVVGKANSDGSIEICVAGHNPPLLVRNSKVQSIHATGVPVGLFCDAEYSVNKFVLDKGDTLLLYSDGLTESVNGSEGGEYGEHRVIEQLANSNGSTPKVFVDQLISDHKTWLNNFKQSDDVTVLFIKRV
jgi:sigma-B regulation protein RsbU (phosphoserine phosphatase)